MYKDVILRSLDYLNRCKILYVYVDTTVLIWQKVDEAFPSEYLQCKS